MSSNIYTRLEELPLSIFIDIVLSGDLTLLYKDTKGEITPELSQLWDDLYVSYASIIGGAEFLHLIDLNLKAQRMTLELRAIDLALHNIEVYGSQKCMESLTELGYKFDPSDITGSCSVVRSKAKGLVVSINTANEEINNIVKGQQTSKPTRQYFESLIDAYEKYKGFSLPENITTYRFAIALVKMQEHYSKKLANG